MTAYDGDTSWAALELVSGNWLTGPGQAVVTDRFLHAAGITIGDSLTLTDPGTGRRERKTVAGVLADATAFEGPGEMQASPLIMAATGLREQFGARARPSGALLAVAPGASEQVLAAAHPQVGRYRQQVRHQVQQPGQPLPSPARRAHGTPSGSRSCWAARSCSRLEPSAGVSRRRMLSR